MGKINWEVAPTVEEERSSIAARLTRYRKAAEAEGVLVDGARFSGSRENRQALREALEVATRLGIETFPTWKDSDGEYHADYPVSHVEEALMTIATRRQALISKEAEYAEGVKKGEITRIHNLDWSV